MKLETKLIVFLSLLVIGLIYFLVSSITKNGQLEKIYKQNELALNDTLKTVRLQNETYYHKYASIQSNLIDREKALKEKDEKILALSSANIILKKMVDSVTGHVVVIGKDSVKGLPFGSVLEFKDKKEFYSYKDSVHIEQVPWIKKELSFIKFRQKNILSRNTDGKWSGYIKFEPEFVNKYISADSAEVIVDRDEFVRVESDIDKFRLSLIPTIGLLQKESSLLGGGIKALINRKHLLEVTKGIGNDWLWIGYGYNFDIIK